MKKTLAIVLVLILALTLFACNSGTDTSDPTTQPSDSAEPTSSQAPPTGSGEAAYPNANEDGTINLDTIAHFDRNYDYTQNEKYKVCYIAQDGGPLYQMSADAYEHWAPLYNMEWVGFISTSGDSDMFMTSLQNQLDQDVRALILDPDSTMIPTVADAMDAYPDAAWMTQMSPSRDAAEGEGVPVGGNLIHPYVGFDNYNAGYQVTQKLIEWKEETYPDVPWSEFAFLSYDYSVVPALHDRVIASQDLWLETTGSLDNFLVADALTFGINLQAGIDAGTPVITTEGSEYQYWLCNGLIDDFALAAASIFDQQGLTDNCCIVTFGGSGLQMQWDAGQQDSFRYALFTAQTLYAEPIIGAVYAYLNGWATPDTIWPSWIKWDDHGEGDHTYAQLRLPTEWLTYDTYKNYLEWTDLYTYADSYPYQDEVTVAIDDYNPYVDEVPADYAPPA